MMALHGILGSISMGSWQVATEKKLDLGLSWPGQLGGQDTVYIYPSMVPTGQEIESLYEPRLYTSEDQTMLVKLYIQSL